MNSILQTIRKLLKIFLFILLGLLALLTILVFRIVTAQMVPKNYTKTFKTGADIEAAYLLEENERADSIFYQKVDRNNIGISGHSQAAQAYLMRLPSMRTAAFLKLPWHYRLRTK